MCSRNDDPSAYYLTSEDLARSDELELAEDRASWSETARQAEDSLFARIFPMPNDPAQVGNVDDSDPVLRGMVELLAAFDAAMSIDAHYPTASENGTADVLEFLQDGRSDVARMIRRTWRWDDIGLVRR